MGILKLKSGPGVVEFIGAGPLKKKNGAEVLPSRHGFVGRVVERDPLLNSSWPEIGVEAVFDRRRFTEATALVVLLTVLFGCAHKETLNERLGRLRTCHAARRTDCQ